MEILHFIEDIKNYDIGEKINERVYKVTRKKPKRNQKNLQLVIKYYKKELNTNKIFLDDFNMQSKLSHPAILPLLNCIASFKSSEDFAVISEYMPNGSLSKLIEEAYKGNHPEGWETIRAINILGIAAGMAYAHQNNIIHRRLDASNILLDSNYYPKITNFLFSLEYNSKYKYFFERVSPMIIVKQRECTDIYAPENFEDRVVTTKVDVFSYAFILYKLFAEKEDEHPLYLPRVIDHGERPSFKNCDIPYKFIELIEKCWDQDPEQRPSFAEIVKDFIDDKYDYFDFDLIDEDAFDEYIELLNLEESEIK